MEHHTFGFVGALVGVGSKEVALGLEEIRGEAGGAVAVVVAEAGAEGRDRDAVQRRDADYFTPVLLGLAEYVFEERIEHEIGEAGVGAVGVGDPIEEAGANDATATPDGGDATEIEAPVFLLAHGFDEIETLCVADDLGGVEGVVNFLHEFGLLGGDVDCWASELSAGGDALFLLRGQNAGFDGGVDGADDDGVFGGIEQSPLAGAFLAGFIDNELDDGFAGFGVFLFQGFAGDLDEVALHVAFVPAIEDSGHLVGGESRVLEDVVGFADELHVAVFDAVVDHLHVVTGTAGADVDDAGLAIDLRGDGFKDGLHDFPSGSRAAGHDGWAFAGTFFTAGDAGTDEAEAFFSEVGIAALGGLVKAVAAVNDDVVFIQKRDELLDDGVHGIAVAVFHGGRFDHDVDLAWQCEALDEILKGVRADEGFAGVLGEEFVGDAGGAVIDAHLKAAAFNVENEVLAHHCEADQSEVTFFTHIGGCRVTRPRGFGKGEIDGIPFGFHLGPAMEVWI
jgi:hypothetical protein